LTLFRFNFSYLGLFLRIINVIAVSFFNSPNNCIDNSPNNRKD